MNVLFVWSALASLDGGVRDSRPDAATARLSDEDQEIIDNLELLQNMDSANDLELLRDLSLER